MCLRVPTMEQPIGYIPSQSLAVLFFFNLGINIIYFIISLTNYWVGLQPGLQLEFHTSVEEQSVSEQKGAEAPQFIQQCQRPSQRQQVRPGTSQSEVHSSGSPFMEAQSPLEAPARHDGLRGFTIRWCVSGSTSPSTPHIHRHFLPLSTLFYLFYF